MREIDSDDLACDEAQAEAERTCYWCGAEADPPLRVAAGMGWCGCCVSCVSAAEVERRVVTRSTDPLLEHLRKELKK